MDKSAMDKIFELALKTKANRDAHRRRKLSGDRPLYNKEDAKRERRQQQREVIAKQLDKD
jgi:hypothetical protein